MLNILINAYACAPHKGSEPGMAWNWIINLANHCQLYVITEGEFKAQIEEAMAALPQAANIKFYYNPVSPRVRGMCWNQGDWRFYYYYRSWQKKTFSIASEIVANHSVDVIHQLNMVGYREPGMLWKVNGIPTVWGPIGGFGGIPFSFLSLYKYGKVFRQVVKDLINRLQVFSPYIVDAIKNMDVLIACNSIAQRSLQRFRDDEIYLIPEVGTSSQLIHADAIQKDPNRLQVLWIGRNYPTKALGLALEVFNGLSDYDIVLEVIGVDLGSMGDNEWQKQKNVIFHSWLPLAQVYKKLCNSHLLLFTSLFEATGTVVLESLTNGVPVLCHDICGQGDIIDDTCGIKVPMVNPKQSVFSFRKAILKLYHDRDLLDKLSLGAIEKAQELTWEKQAQQMVQLYHEAIAKRGINNN
ncbi:glycosyltransferase family 4 protein [Sunxiuqinia sp. sy24]|uniref:glycosyltransferase family 4 protein n=1 Tax=Sunxiuqinia sp. sy24 TaxID=3461495 RepID=UPI0040462A6C